MRVIHPDWDGHRRAGAVVEIINRFHARVLFDGWSWPVTALRSRLELVVEDIATRDVV